MAEFVRCCECGKKTDVSRSNCLHCGADQLALCICGAVLSTYSSACGECGEERETPWPYRVQLVRTWIRLLRTWARVAVLGALLVGTIALIVIASQVDSHPSRRTEFDRAAQDLRSGRDEMARIRLVAVLAERAGATAVPSASETEARAGPDDATAWYLLAVACFRLDRTNEARDAIERAFDLRATAPGVATLAARCRLAGGDPRGALDAVAASDEAESRVVRAHALIALGRPAAASDEFADAIADGLSNLPLLTESTLLAAELGARAFPGAAKYRARAEALAAQLGTKAERVAIRSPDDPAAALALAVVADLDAQLRRTDVARLYRRAASLERGSTAARAARVRFLTQEGRNDDARAAVADTIERDADAAADLIDALSSAGDVEGAVLALRVVCTGSPDNDRARTRLVHGLLALDRPEEAFETAGSEETSDSELLTARGDAAAALGDRDRANTCYDAALAERPDAPSLIWRRHGIGLAGLWQAIVAGREPTVDEAAAGAALGRVLEGNPDEASALAWSSRLASAEGSTRDAFVLARRWVAITPDDPAARELVYVTGCAAGGAYDPELDAMAESLVLADGVPLDDFRVFGAAAIDCGRPVIALRVTVAGVMAWPDDESAKALRARALLLFSGAHAAEAHIIESFGAQPATIEVRELLAWSRVLDGRPDEAVATLPASNDPRGAASRSYLLAAVGRLDEAEAGLRDAIAVHPDDPVLVHALVALLLTRGRSAEALRLIDPFAASTDADLSTLSQLSDALAASPTDMNTGRLTALRERLAAHPEGSVELLRVDARLALAAGDTVSALQRMERFVALRPTEAATWYEVADLRERTGDRDSAIRALRRSIEIEPINAAVRGALATLLYEEASRRLGAGHGASGRAALEETLTLAPDWTSARVALAATLYELGLPDLSAVQCRKILEQEPENLIARVVQALTKQASGDTARALAELDGLVVQYPDHGALRLYGGLMRLQSARTDEAAVDFREAAAAGCGGAQLEYGLAGCAVFAGDASRALVHARRAVELAPLQAFAHRALAEALALAGDTDAAVAAFNRAHACAPRESLPVLAATRLLLDAGRWDAATAEVGRLGRPRGVALALLAEADLGAGRTEDALRRFAAAGPDYARAWLRAAAIAEERGDHARAITSYRAALAAGVTDRTVRLHVAALLLNVSHETVEAQGILEGLVTEDPRDAVALNNLAAALAESIGDPPPVITDAQAARRRSQLARALELAQRARRIVPGDPDVADTLGRLCWLEGDVATARILFEESIHNGARAEARYHLALVESREGHIAAARELLLRALADAPEAPWSADARALLATTAD